MKPASMRKFDWLYLGSIVVGLLGLVIGWDAIKQMTETQMAAAGATELDPQFGTVGLLIGAGLSAAMMVALWFVISILRVGFARWLVVLMLAYSLVSIPMGLLASGTIETMQIPGIIAAVMQVAAVWFLFRPDAKAWFAEKRGAPHI